MKHLSSRRKRNRRDALSSGERKGQSLNPKRVKLAGVAYRVSWELSLGTAILEGSQKPVL